MQISESIARNQTRSASSRVQVVSDVVCPWCFIGKRRLEKALALMGRGDVKVHWTAFQLNPDSPKDGYERSAYRARKFGSPEYARQLEVNVAAAGAEEGIEFRFDRIARVPNTFDAHRLIWLAGREHLQDAVVEKLFRAYFIEGKDVGSADVLKSVAAEAGLSDVLVSELLTTDLGKDEVRTEEQHARRYGVSGVPTFFVDGEPIASGAQKPALLAAVLNPALGSGVCSTDGCSVLPDGE